LGISARESPRGKLKNFRGLFDFQAREWYNKSMEKDVVQIRDWLYVGNCDECINNYSNYDAIIHIKRSDMEHYSCQFNSSRGGNDLTLDYKDGDKIPQEVFEKLEKFYEENKGPYKKIFVHCYVGQTRGPTIALALLSIAFKNSPLCFLGEVIGKIRNERKIVPNICLSPLTNMLDWIDGKNYFPRV